MYLKLTDLQVREIREKYQPYSREYGTTALAKQYGVSKQHIFNIISKKARRIIRGGYINDR